jgi:hypothetical protein
MRLAMPTIDFSVLVACIVASVIACGLLAVAEG